ncbi:MAG: PhoH family protein [Bacteroidia bacterium]|nr:PhoH family protein [Bacteroidia bacterium]
MQKVFSKFIYFCRHQRLSFAHIQITKLTEKQFLLGHVSPLEFYGVNNLRFRQLKEQFPDVVFVARGNELKVRGPENEIDRATGVVERLVRYIEKGGGLSEEAFNEIISGIMTQSRNGSGPEEGGDLIMHGSRGNIIRARTEGQREIMDAVTHNDIVFAIGPAGTGKTYTAVAMAVKALKEKQVRKIALCRPAVEAGENLGFLPGDLKEKVDPYLRPLYDALEDMLHFEKLKSYLEKNIIEITPLAYMRGRTLSNCFVILDEAQNATENQLKMFLTRLGRDSKAVITGDDSQIDLPRKQSSGLVHAARILTGVEGIAVIRTQPTDVMRHRLVKRIIAAYEDSDTERKKLSAEKRN